MDVRGVTIFPDASQSRRGHLKRLKGALQPFSGTGNNVEDRRSHFTHGEDDQSLHKDELLLEDALHLSVSPLFFGPYNMSSSTFEPIHSLHEATRPKNAPITGAYTGKSSAIKITMIFLTGLSIYNALELLLLISMKFTRYRTLYFYSLVISSLGIVPYSIGFILKFFDVRTGGSAWFSIVLLTVGWWAMVTGHSVVLWSRLGIILSGRRGYLTLQWTKYMIIIDAIILHLPTTVLTFGCNGDIDTQQFVRVFDVYEKVQMVGFFVQETIIASIYIVETVPILRRSLQPRKKFFLIQLLAINVIIILLNIALLILEMANFYVLEATSKSVVYSVKLKLEFAVLSQLITFFGGNRTNSVRQPSADLGHRDDRRTLDGDGVAHSADRITMPGNGSGGKNSADASGCELRVFEHL